MPKDPVSAKKAVKKTAKPKAVAASVAATKTPAAQESFLDELIRAHTRVAIFLVNGVKLEGEIKSYDRYVILMRNAVSDKVYKHAVSTIMPVTGHAPVTGVVIERRTSRRASLTADPHD